MKKDRYLTWTNYLVSGTVITVLGIIAIVGGVNLYRWTKLCARFYCRAHFS